MWELDTEMEFPLVGVLARMEPGDLVDREYLRANETEAADARPRRGKHGARVRSST